MQSTSLKVVLNLCWSGDLAIAVGDTPTSHSLNFILQTGVGPSRYGLPPYVCSALRPLCMLLAFLRFYPTRSHRSMTKLAASDQDCKVTGELGYFSAAQNCCKLVRMLDRVLRTLYCAGLTMVLGEAHVNAARRWRS